MRDYNSRRLLLDTSIILDLVASGRPQRNEARAVIKRCNGGGDMGLVASTSLKDAYYVLTKIYGEERAREAIEHLMGLLVIVPVAGEECDMSLRSNEPDFGDGIIRACAELNDVEFILTRNAAAFKKSYVRSMDCASFLAIAS